MPRTPHTRRRHATRALAGATLAALAGATRAHAQHPVGAPPAAGDQRLTPRALESGVYGGPEVRATRLAGQGAVLAGARGGWIINHHLLLGVAGYANAGRAVRAGRALPSGRAADLGVGYGGVDLGWVHRPSRPVHLTLGALVGAGAVGYRDPAAPVDGWTDTGDAFFVTEPSAALELNLAPRVRVALGGSYRLVRGARLATVRDRDLQGPAGTLMVKFGKF